MASVTFPASVGGDNSTVSDDADVNTGLKNGGATTRFIPALAQFVAIAQYVITQATAAMNAAAASASSALNAPGTSATSTTSLTIGTGNQVFTLAQTGKAFALGQFVVIANTAAPGNQMVGIITAFNSGTGAITVNVSATAGAGTFTAWTISLAANSGVQSVAGLNGAVSGAALKAALAIQTTDLSDYTTKTTAIAVAMAAAMAA